MKAVIFCSVIFSFMLGCRKNTENSVNQNASDIFPNKVGDSWTYQVNDTTYSLQYPVSVTQYNMTVSIIESIILSGGIKANVWVYRYPNRTDTNFVFQSGDTISFVSNKKLYPEIVRQYIIPFSIHNSWKYSWLSVHDVVVDSMANITIGSNLFKNAFHIFGYPGKPDEIIGLDEWLEDNVGVIKRYVDGSGTNNPNKFRTGWSLLNYHLE